LTRRAKMTIATVITTYNCGPFLEEALASVLAQTRQPDEIIIMDDGSTDDTPARMEKWAAHIQYRWQTNAGIGEARNRAWHSSNSTWIAFLDADDLWLPDKLKQQEAWVRDHPETEAVFGLAQNFAQPGSEARFDDERNHLNQWLPGWLPSALMVRRTTLERTGGFDTKLKNAEAVEWFIRCREAEVTMDMPEFHVSRRRLHGANNRLVEGSRQAVDLQLLRGFIARKRARQAGA
jgi:glycosyltransferase involved in cell wall biosynthesis